MQHQIIKWFLTKFRKTVRKLSPHIKIVICVVRLLTSHYCTEKQHTANSKEKCLMHFATYLVAILRPPVLLRAIVLTISPASSAGPAKDAHDANRWHFLSSVCQSRKIAKKYQMPKLRPDVNFNVINMLRYWICGSRTSHRFSLKPFPVLMQTPQPTSPNSNLTQPPLRTP